MAKRRTNTKSYTEFKKLLKNIKSKERYYGKLGVELPKVGDIFSMKDASSKNLRELKKYSTTLKKDISKLQKEARALSAKTGISLKTAYGAIGAERSGGVAFGAIAYDNFMAEVDKLATLSSRNVIREFALRLEWEVGKEAAGEALASVVTDANFEALLHYNKPEVEATHISSVITKIRANVGNLTVDEILDKMEYINE